MKRRKFIKFTDAYGDCVCLNIDAIISISAFKRPNPENGIEKSIRSKIEYGRYFTDALYMPEAVEDIISRIEAACVGLK